MAIVQGDAETEASGGLLDGLAIGKLEESEVEAAVGVLSRGMRDNPVHVAVYGADPELRRRRLRRMFGAGMEGLGLHRHMLVARGPDAEIVGVCGMIPPGECRPGAGQILRLLPHVLALGPATASRTMTWLGAWAKEDPEERHWHLGPVAVDAHLQGRGIGGLLLGRFCELMDDTGEDAYLETDKQTNVSFYERFGFGVVGEQLVVGTNTWFMLRQAGRRKGLRGIGEIPR